MIANAAFDAGAILDGLLGDGQEVPLELALGQGFGSWPEVSQLLARSAARPEQEEAAERENLRGAGPQNNPTYFL